MRPPQTKSPAIDLPSLAVHALWWGWFPALVVSWSHLSWAGRGGMLVAGWAVLFWNYAVLHNHMHVPIVKPSWPRWVVSRTLGLACGFPYRGYYLFHFNHHKYNDGPGDWGQRLPGESVPHYLARLTLRAWFWPWELVANVWRATKTRAQRLELVMDFVLVDGTLLGLLFWEPLMGLGFWGMVMVGHVSIYWLNLAAHFGSDPSRKDSLGVTSTSRLYNFFFFNAGFHQAHHYWPQVPWQELPAATRELAASARVRPTLQTSQAPINPFWVVRVIRSYSAEPCDRQTASTITSGTPSAVT
ncbi:MAG: fatty acid desaturase [Myxococcaceae bacterium]|nr:fatty acid desaturase [Myxococcaceae bacterium]